MVIYSEIYSKKSVRVGLKKITNMFDKYLKICSKK